jgi:hypothetical protein
MVYFDCGGFSMNEIQEMFDEWNKQYYSQARELILEMKTGFIPYLEVLMKLGTGDTERDIILFGIYLSKAKQNAKGEKIISTSGFEKFLFELASTSGN